LDDRYEAHFDAGYSALPSPEFPGDGRWQQPVDVDNPALGALVPADQVRQVVAEAQPPRLFVATGTGIAALGPEGLVWREPRIAVDGLHIHATSPYLVCSVDALNGGTDQIRLDPATGALL